MSSKNKTQVIIAGKIYTLSGYESEEYLQRVAAYLNGKISEFKNVEGYSRLSPEMRGIMLNLNTADDYLLSGKAVVLNMEGIHTEVAQRIIDFTSGATYSMRGNLQKISSYIFIATPDSVELSGDFQDLLTGGGLGAGGLNIHL